MVGFKVQPVDVACFIHSKDALVGNWSKIEGGSNGFKVTVLIILQNKIRSPNA